MNDLLKRALFILIAAFINLVLIVAFFTLLTFIFSMVLKGDAELFKMAYSLSLFLSVVGSFFFYRKILRWADEKWNLSEKFGEGLFPPSKK